MSQGKVCKVCSVCKGRGSWPRPTPCLERVRILAWLPNHVIFDTDFSHLRPRKRIERGNRCCRVKSYRRPFLPTRGFLITRANYPCNCSSCGSGSFRHLPQKTLKTFTSGEAAQLVGVSDGYLRQLSIDGKGPSPEFSSTGRRSYTLGQINELRQYMASAKPKDAESYLPRRRQDEKLQTIAVANFKGGSAKTTTTIYLAQYLALQGYRVLAVDLDPQASLSSMLGVQPEFDLARRRHALWRDPV